MDKQEAIEIITNAVQTDNMTEEQDKALAVVQKAVAILTPRTPDLEGDGYSDGHLVYDTWICPNCETHYEMEYEEHDHCPKCGQAIDWEAIKEGQEDG